MRVVPGLAITAAVLVGACSNAPAGDGPSARGAVGRPSADVGDLPGPGLPSPGEGEAGRAAAAGRETGTASAPPRAVGRSGPAPAAPDSAAEPASTGAAAYDAFDQRARLPEGATRVASGRNPIAEWRLYAWRKDGKACLHFSSQSAAFGGASGTCHQQLPLDASSSTSEHGRFVYGLVSAEATRVRIEHAGGVGETFDAVASPGYVERFYGGEIGTTPLTRIVALDANGKVVATKDDVSSLNEKGQ